MNSIERTPKITPVASYRLRDQGIAELVYSREEQTTGLATYRKGTIAREDAIEIGESEKIVPISPENNLIKHRAILLPELAEEYESVSELTALISGYLYKYVDLSHSFRKIATAYILLTWVYDAFNELPYLRLRGDFGSGKTRALTVIGGVCYRPFFASGASTVSPIFHTLDSFGGTLVLDEADFRFTDEKSELVKIFNNGNVRGFPVLRTAITMKKEFDPRAFNVYGPKIIAMRRSFEDQALESRFLTEEMGQRKLRSDIPINLPDEQKDEALSLRNKLLMYRFKTLDAIKLKDHFENSIYSPRLNQILIPLLSLVEDKALRDEIWATAGTIEGQLYRNRSASVEAEVLEILSCYIREEGRSHITIKEITTEFMRKYGEGYNRPITHRLIGSVIRTKLHLFTYKSHGNYVVPMSEASKIVEMCTRFGVNREESGRHGDAGDVGAGVEEMPVSGINS